MEIVYPKYLGTVYEVKKKLEIHGFLEVLELEALVDYEGS